MSGKLIIEQPTKAKTWTLYGAVTLVLLVFLFMVSLTGSGPLTEGLKVSASNMETQIDTACQAYRTEYGVLPPSSENYRLTKAICGDNPRKIEFISLKTSNMNPNGEIIDPWKTPYRIIFDTDSKVHIVSAGPDKIFGTPDDITSQ